MFLNKIANAAIRQSLRAERTAPALCDPERLGRAELDLCAPPRLRHYTKMKNEKIQKSKLPIQQQES